MQANGSEMATTGGDATLQKSRWWLVLAAVCFQMSLGAAYAWSVFCIPLSRQFGWSISQVSFAFTIGWFFLGSMSVAGGFWLHHTTPRVVAITGGVFWGAGMLLTSLTIHSLWLVYLTYGVIGGIGLGLGYIVPIATLVKWFPDRRGLIVGLAVGGFGSGSLISAPLAHHLIVSVGLSRTFLYLGLAYAAVAITSGSFLKNPPVGWTPPGWVPSEKQTTQRSAHDYTLGQALRHWQWWALCAFLCVNTMAGLSVMSQAAPIFQEMGHASPAAAAGLVGMISVGNGLGRVFWAWISDLTSRKVAFFLIYFVQVVLYLSYQNVTSLAVMALITGILLTCYGGGYGVTPAFAADYFGPHHVGSIFGFMMLPWAFACVIGPSTFAYLRQVTGSYSFGLHLIAGMLTVALIFPLLIFPPHTTGAKTVAPVDEENSEEHASIHNGRVVDLRAE